MVLNSNPPASSSALDLSGYSRPMKVVFRNSEGKKDGPAVGGFDGNDTVGATEGANVGGLVWHSEKYTLLSSQVVILMNRPGNSSKHWPKGKSFDLCMCSLAWQAS